MTSRTSGALALAMVLSVALAACSKAGTVATSSPVSTTDGSPMPGASGADLDQAFIDMMVPHHQAAIEMAKVAQERATREELRSMADGIITAQAAEIAQLREWRQAWFGSSDTPGMDAMPLMPGMDMPGMEGMEMEGTMDMTNDVEELRTAEPFDKAFMESMMEHHESAIAAAEIIDASTRRSELKQVAADIIEAQQAEIDQMQGWLDAWYPN